MKGLEVLVELSGSASACRGEGGATGCVFGNRTRLRFEFELSSLWCCSGVVVAVLSPKLGLGFGGRKGSWRLNLGKKEKRFGNGEGCCFCGGSDSPITATISLVFAIFV